MSDAMQTLQGAVVTALETHPALATVIGGVYDGPGQRSVYPYVSIGDGSVADWSCKLVKGREIALMLTVWDDGEDAVRLQNIMESVEEAIAALPRDLPGWRIASNIFLRARIVRDADGPWAGMVDHRIRMMEV